jgi:tRNA (guanine-N7-)-methyltransferase
MQSFHRVYQPDFEDVYKRDYRLKGAWSREVFDNAHPITLELGCGKGEYTISLARRFPERNFIGIDIKGARIWRGAKTAHEEALENVAFLRTRIELILSFFSRDEVEELWITFPDPQEKRRRRKKRLTGPRFLNLYRQFLVDNGTIHLKTDNDRLYRYTFRLAEYNNLEILHRADDLYASDIADDLRTIRTHYESQYLEEEKTIHYLAFRLPRERMILELPDEEE